MTFEQAMKYPIADIIRGFVNLRDKIKKQDSDYAGLMADSREQLKIFNTAAQAKVQEQGVNSIACDHGTAYLNHADTVGVENFEAFAAWIAEEEGREEFLVRAVAGAKVKEWMERELAESGRTPELPPGLKMTSVVTCNIRK